jgi:solute carrier family 25, member 39/40
MAMAENGVKRHSHSVSVTDRVFAVRYFSPAPTPRPSSISRFFLTLCSHKKASVGGALSAFFVTPLDVVKTRLQSQQHGGLRATRGGEAVMFRNSIEALYRIPQREGVPALWRGLQPTLVMAIPAAALYFALYDGLKIRLREELSARTGDPTAGLVAAPVIAGLGARVVTTTVTSPLEMARTFLQASETSALRDVVAAVRVRGFGVLWQGLAPTLWRDAPFSAMYWSLYEWSKHRVIGPRMERWAVFGRSDHPYVSRLEPFVVDFIAGASSGMVAAYLTTPLDLAKTHMQMDLLGQRRGVMEIFRGTYGRLGVAGLFTGAVPRTVRAAPSCAIMISSYEMCMRYLRTSAEVK